MKKEIKHCIFWIFLFLLGYILGNLTTITIKIIN